jgi:hypothetical protein
MKQVPLSEIDNLLNLSLGQTSVPPLSNLEIIETLRKNGIDGVKFVPYCDLKHLESIEQILPCILLYQLHAPVGHWVCLFKNYEDDKETIQYFDPTGHVPDGLLETNFDHPAGRVKMNADFTYLNQLLLDDIEANETQLVYNDFPLQPPDTNTCGYWCAVRMICGSMSCDDFNDQFKSMDDQKRQDIIVKLYQKVKDGHRKKSKGRSKGGRSKGGRCKKGSGQGQFI